MIWIRFGRNEPPAPSLPLRSSRGDPLDVHTCRQGGTLVLLFAPSGGMAGCGPLLSALAGTALHEEEAELLIVTPHAGDLIAHPDLPAGYDEDGRLRALYGTLMAVDSGGKTLLFILDRDGSPVYAWVGECDEANDLPGEVMTKVRSAAFLCPECSVPDPASSALWDAVY